MHLARLHRSTPFRIALIITLIAIGAFVTSTYFAYLLIRTDLDNRRTRDISELHAAISRTYHDNGASQLVEVVRANIAASHSRKRVFALLTQNGRSIAANMDASHVQMGFSDHPATDIGIATGGDFRVLLQPVGDYRLAVGISDSDTEQIRTVILESLLWAMLGMLAVSLAGGVFMATNMQRRLDRFKGTFERVAQGDLSARLSLDNPNDDLGMLWSSVNSALDRLSSLVEGMRQVSSDIAHDLKTPLNRLKFTIESARLQEESGKPVAELLDKAAGEADSINETFSALLSIAQIEAGARKARFRQFDLAETLSSVADIYSDVAADAGQNLSLDELPGGQVLISGDSELMTQLLANLVENAIRHCPAGTNICCGITVDGGKVAMHVSDDGPGVPQADRENILRRFYRMEKSRTTPGSGLGLSLVKAIADLHGARLSVGDNQPGLRIELVFPAITT